MTMKKGSESSLYLIRRTFKFSIMVSIYIPHRYAQDSLDRSNHSRWVSTFTPSCLWIWLSFRTSSPIINDLVLSSGHLHPTPKVTWRVSLGSWVYIVGLSSIPTTCGLYYDHLRPLTPLIHNGESLPNPCSLPHSLEAFKSGSHTITIGYFR